MASSPPGVPPSLTSFTDQFERLRIDLMKEFTGLTEQHLKHKVDWCLFPTWSTRFITGTVVKQGQDSLNNFVNQLKNCKSSTGKVKLLLDNEKIDQMIQSSVDQAIKSLNTNSGSSFSKNLAKSRQFMRQGLQHLKDNQIKKALEFFDKGLIYSPFPEDVDDQPSKSHLSMCLVNRSRVYQMLRRYPESWIDMKDAVEYMLFPRMAEELMKAKFQLMMEIGAASGRKPKPGGMADMDFEPFDVVLRPENKNLHGALETLEVAFSPEKGRHIVTTKAIKANTTVLAEEPYSAWLQPSLYSNYCGHCLRPLDERLFPCRGCTLVFYCSSKCSEQSWRSYHSVECEYMPILQYLSIGHMALRTLIKAGIETALEMFKKNSQDRDSTVLKSCKSFFNTFEDINTLMGKQEGLEDIKILSMISGAAFMTKLAQAMGLIDVQSLKSFGGLMLTQISQLVVNGLTISDDRSINTNGLDFQYYAGNGGHEIGSGLYASASLLSHSCEPNCDRVFIGSKIVLNTNRGLNEGQEITITYGPTKDGLALKDRQKFLKDNFYFDCVCDTCKKGQ